MMIYSTLECHFPDATIVEISIIRRNRKRRNLNDADRIIDLKIDSKMIDGF